MEKKPYETPEIQLLGSVRDLTALVAPCPGSADTDFVCEDGVCCIDHPA